MSIHTVRAGETIYSIAGDQGIANWRVIYDHPNNAQLRELRPDPGILHEGDDVFIPETSSLGVVASTGTTNWFVATRPPYFVDLILEDMRGDALCWRACSLKVEGETIPGHTDERGHVRFSLPFGASEGELEITGAHPDSEPLRYTLKVGELDPVETVRGQQARLNNLGFVCGEHDGAMNDATRKAMEAFQLNHGLEGEDPAGVATLDRLQRVHRGEPCS